MSEWITPPDHIEFSAKKLYGEGRMQDVAVAHLQKGGGGPQTQHTHPHDHLFIVTQGEAKILLGEKTVIVKQDERFLVRGSIPHSVWNNADEPAVIVGITLLPSDNA